jgi:hypothetical protein
MDSCPRNVYLVLMARDHVSQIRTRLAEIDGQLAALTAEADELRTAQRVLERMGNVRADTDAPVRRIVPESIGAMAATILSEKGPMESRALWEELRKRRPDMTFETLSGTLARWKRAGRISLNGKKWRAVSKGIEAQGNGAMEPHEFRPTAEQTGTA